MAKLSFDLENCYGIRRLRHEVRLDANGCAAIYAPNGSMKTSLAKTLQDLSKGEASKDLIFPERITRRSLSLDGHELPTPGVFVVRSYDEMFSNSDKTATLLVNHDLRVEYEKLTAGISKTKDALIKSLKKTAGTKLDIEREISMIFMRNDHDFVVALKRVKDEVISESPAPFAQVPYELIFGDKAAAFLSRADVKVAIAGYISNYNELLGRSNYFRKGIFNYYNASTIAKNLSDNGFFNAKHTLRLNGSDEVEVAEKQQLEAIIEAERDTILNNPELRESFAGIEKAINANAGLRELHGFLLDHEDIIPELQNLESFRQKVWISYLKSCSAEYLAFLDCESESSEMLIRIEKQASDEGSQWNEVVRIFNERFTVPFRLEVRNRLQVMLGQESIPTLGFSFEDSNGETAEVNRSDLLKTLSTGELKALYILNVIFEIEVRRKQGHTTLFVIDDIADSFDYKNKYAIIEYLRDMAEEDERFLQLVLTHNFDFFRTTEARYVDRRSCYMAVKGTEEVRLEEAYALKGIFPTWRNNFFSDTKMKIACIPFIRNLVEYTADQSDPRYLKLTSMLHMREDTMTFSVGDLDELFCGIFAREGKSQDPGKPIVDLIIETADLCLNDPEGINLENKIVTSMAIRMVAEKFMAFKVNDPEALRSITSNQTGKLYKLYKQRVTDHEKETTDVLRKVMLMTPESIHLNSFMYEPILDMSDSHLKSLYRRVKAL